MDPDEANRMMKVMIDSPISLPGSPQHLAEQDILRRWFDGNAGNMWKNVIEAALGGAVGGAMSAFAFSKLKAMLKLRPTEKPKKGKKKKTKRRKPQPYRQNFGKRPPKPRKRVTGPTPDPKPDPTPDPTPDPPPEPVVIKPKKRRRRRNRDRDKRKKSKPSKTPRETPKPTKTPKKPTKTPKPVKTRKTPTTKGETRLGGEVYYHDRGDDLMALFKRLDKDGSGKLTAGELAPLAKQMGLSGKDLVMDMDKNGDKQAEWPEFRRYLRRK